MRAAFAGMLLALVPIAAPAQDWSFIDPMMARTLDIQPGEGPAMLFADHPDPAVAAWGLGFHYFESRTGGNSFGLNVGLFQHQDGGWVHLGPVNGLFGLDPRNPSFLSGRIEITTMTLGPNDARCCPTEEARWAVDTQTRHVERLR